MNLNLIERGHAWLAVVWVWILVEFKAVAVIEHIHLIRNLNSGAMLEPVFIRISRKAYDKSGGIDARTRREADLRAASCSHNVAPTDATSSSVIKVPQMPGHDEFPVQIPKFCSSNAISRVPPTPSTA